MKSMRFRPAFVFRFVDSLKAAGVFCGVMLAVLVGIYALFVVTVQRGDGSVSGSFVAFGFSACIMAFVSGIVTVREDLRMMNQMGVSRRTAFAAELSAGVLVLLMIAAAGEIICTVGQVVMNGVFQVNDLYGVLYLGFGETLGVLQHLKSLLFNTAIMLVAAAFGKLLSLLIYRLPKPWKVIVAVGIPLLVVWGIPVVAITFSGAAFSLLQFLAASFWNLCGFCLLVAAVLTAFNYLLMRRAPVRAAAK